MGGHAGSGDRSLCVSGWDGHCGLQERRQLGIPLSPCPTEGAVACLGLLSGTRESPLASREGPARGRGVGGQAAMPWV